MSFLEKVVAEKQTLVRVLKEKTPIEQLKGVIDNGPRRPFREVFSGRCEHDARIIAEVKKASPSRGMLRPDLNVTTLVQAYEEGGAAAISVITEGNHFLGALSFLSEAKEATGLPILRKDFIVDAYELYETKAAGADAVLLIGEALERSRIEDLLHLAGELALDVLLEIHSMETYRKIEGLEGFVLGINNRNLETLKVDLNIALSILGNIPDDCPVIVESGIESREDIERFIERGASGFLIGTSLVLSQDPVQKLKELRGERV